MSADEYEKRLSEQDEIIHQQEARIDKLNIAVKKQLTVEQTETGNKVVTETKYCDVIAQVKSLYNQGEYDEAYRIADDIRQKRPDFVQAYFMLGTMEILSKNYDKGEGLLNKAVQLGLPDEDMTWALHNLGISSV